MPSKSKITPKSKSRFSTRTAILRDYGLSDQTLRRLIDSLGLVTLPAVTEHGKVLYEISPAADFGLRLGGLCPFSFTEFRPPMLRFVQISSITGTLDETVASLNDRKIINRSVELDDLSGIYDQLLAAVPEELYELFKDKRAPKTEDESAAYAAALAVMGVSSVYQSPDVLEQFYFHDDNLLHLVHQVIWTHSASAETKASVINQAVGSHVITAEGLLLYAHIFHDNEFMRDTDLTKYCIGLPPKYRTAYRKALTLTTEAWLVEAQLAQDTLTELVHINRQCRAKIRELMASADPTARIEGARLLTTALKLDDHIGKVRPEASNKKMPEHLKTITPEPYRFEELFQLPAELNPKDSESDVG